MRAVLVLSLLLAAGTAYADQLVPGDPPLTDEIVDHTCDFLEWAIATPFTLAQRDEAKHIMIAFWKKHDKAAIAAVQQVLQLRDQLLQSTPESRAQAQPKVEAKLVESMRAQPSDPTNHWLLGIYDAGHKSIADGEPALTQQTVAALAEMLGFVLGQAHDGKPLQPSAKDIDQLAKKLAAEWGKLEVDQRKQLAAMPSTWASVRMEWAGLTAADRKKYREQWAKALAPAKPAGKGGTASHYFTMMQYRAMATAFQGMSDTNNIIICNMNPGCTYTYVWR